MIEKVRLLLKSKYGLVHVPNVHKTRRWIEATRARIAAGEPSEQAGGSAAEEIFPYEFKPHRVPGETEVEDILAADNPDSG
ncbi:MAG: hypothetical protein ACQETQ_13295 [Spirochaetota bacterium]